MLTRARATATRCFWPPESWSGFFVRLVGHADELEHAVDLGPDLRLGPLGDREAEADVVADGQVGEEGVALEDGVDLALVGGEAGDVAAVEEDAAGVGLLEAGGQAQHGRLAAAARAEKREELALLEAEGDVVDGPDGAEPLGNAAEFEECVAQSRSIIEEGTWSSQQAVLRPHARYVSLAPSTAGKERYMRNRLRIAVTFVISMAVLHWYPFRPPLPRTWPVIGRARSICPAPSWPSTSISPSRPTGRGRATSPSRSRAPRTCLSPASRPKARTSFSSSPGSRATRPSRAS